MKISETSSRRNFLRTLGTGALALGASTLPQGRAAAGHDEHTTTTLSPDEALARLQEGNAAFLAGNPRPLADAQRRLAIAPNQTPFTVLVGCSDSRVPPEILFGLGLGELFIVRNAGNTVDLTALGSIEYAVTQLGVPLIVVMGHENCGAVSAALSVVEENTVYPGAINDMIEPIIPAVLAVRDQPGNFLDNSVRENVRRIVTRLSNSEPLLLEPLAAGNLKIVGARYDLDTGEVDFFA